jgi:predicted ATPase
MLDALVRAIGTSVPADVEPLDAITDFLKSRAALLVLDNFEQIMDAALQVGQILASCPRVKVLVTSRESLRLRGERLVTVAPLAMPDPRPGLTAAEALESDAVRLFVARADEARPGFVLTDAEAPAVGEICAQLDGLPLAIELAAASLRLLSPEDLRDRLRNQLEPVASGPRDLPDRQRTLRSTIEWSHELLDPDERQLFAALSVFSSASIEAVQQVISRVQPLSEVDPLRTLTALVDKSLLRSDPVAGVQRIEMLATIRRFAAEKLAEAPEVAAAIAEAHAAYFAGVAAETRSPRPGQPHGAAVDRLAAELDNLEVAWRYYLARADIGQLNKLATGLWLIYEGRGWYHRVLALANDLLEVLGTEAPSPEHADDEVTLRLALARTLLAIRGYTPEVERLYQEALAVSQAAQAAPRRLAVLRSLGSFYLYRAEVDRTAEIGHKLLELAAETDDRRLELEGHMMVGPATAFMGDAETGLGHLQRAMDLFDPEEHRSTPFRLGPNPGVAAPVVSALFRWWLGQPDTASQQVARALEQADRLEHPYTVAWSHFHAGVLDVWNRDYASAQRRATRVLQAASEHDYRIWQALGQVMEGVSLAALDDAHRGAERAVSGVAMYEGIQAPPVFWPLVLSLKAEALARAGEMGESMRTLDQALEVEREGNWLSAMFDAQKAEVLVRTGRPAEAVTWLLRSAKEARALGALMLHLRALVRLSEIDGGADRSGLRTELAALLDAFEEGRDNPDVMKARRIAASDS